MSVLLIIDDFVVLEINIRNIENVYIAAMYKPNGTEFKLVSK